MTIYNLGSINIDYFYKLPHLVKPGETLSSKLFYSTLGGKGANQSIAISRAGGEVFHGGLINEKDKEFLKIMKKSKVDTRYVLFSKEPTGHAIVAIDETNGDNQIILYPSCNNKITKTHVHTFLKNTKNGDWALSQNETNMTEYFFKKASERGLFICYSAAPFIASQTIKLLTLVDLLILNEMEMQELIKEAKTDVKNLSVPHIIITMGKKGVKYFGKNEEIYVPGKKVDVFDTTGAGDTFLGYFLAFFDKTKNIQSSLDIANSAASIQVTRNGASIAIPNLKEVLNWKINIK